MAHSAPALRTGRTRTAAIATAAAAGLLLTAFPTTAVAAAPTATQRSSTSYARTIAAERAAARAALRATGASSLSLALVDSGKVVWQETFGAVDSAGTAPSATTAYGIGSVSKMLATVAVMQLVDAGKVSLDDPVTKYVNDFSMADPAYRQITVRMLLNHSAGFPGSDYGNGMTEAPFPQYADQVLRTLRGAHLKTTPGSMSVYCNDCFTVAGIVVSRVSGKAFTDYVEDSIFAPLDMVHSGYVTSLPPADPIAPVLAADGTVTPLEVTNIYASGGAYSTPTDMSHFAAMLINGGTYAGRRIVSAAAVTQMGSDQTRTTLDPAIAKWIRYGLGWDTVADPGMAAVKVNTWVKGGDTGDYHAGLMVAPAANLAVVVLGAGRSFSSTVAEELGQETLLRALVDQHRLAAMPKKLGASTLARVSPTSAQLAAVRGTYLGSEFAGRVVVNADKTISLAVPGDDGWTTAPTRYSLRTDGRFWSDGTPGTAVWSTSAWGRGYLVTSEPMGYGHYFCDVVVGQRSLAAPALSPAWQRRVGRSWLLVNEVPSSRMWATPETGVMDVPDTPGYLFAGFGGVVDASQSDTVAPMALVVPTVKGRDLNDVVMLPRDGEEWMQIGSMVARPKDTVPPVLLGSNAITFGMEGYAEWRTVAAASHVVTTGAVAWRLYDAQLSPLAAGTGDAAGIAAPTGALLLLFGTAGSTVTTTVVAG